MAHCLFTLSKCCEPSTQLATLVLYNYAPVREKIPRIAEALLFH